MQATQSRFRLAISNRRFARSLTMVVLPRDFVPSVTATCCVVSRAVPRLNAGRRARPFTIEAQFTNDNNVVNG